MAKQFDATGKIITGTGHRPHKLGGYDKRTFDKLCALALAELRVLQPAKVISGMALGWDQALASAAVALGIPYIAAVPFKGQDSIWPTVSIKQYRVLLKKAETIEIVCPGGFSTLKMQTRNRWMIDRCDAVLALWDGTSGGTANCVRYAREKKKPVINAWPRWEDF